MKKLKDILISEGMSMIGSEQELKKAITLLRKVQKDFFSKVTNDDDVHDGLGGAISRLEELLDNYEDISS